MSSSWSEYQFRSPTMLAKLVTAAFIPYIAGAVYLLFLFHDGLGLMHAITGGQDVPEETLTALDVRFEETWLPLIACQLVGVVAFCV